MSAANTIKPGWFSLRGAAIYTGFSDTAIRAAIKAELLPARHVRITGTQPQIRINRDHLDAWIEGRPMWEVPPGLTIEEVPVPRGMRPVLIREEDFLNINQAGALVGMKDPVNAFVAHLIANTADDPSNLLELVQGLRDNQEADEALDDVSA